MSLLHIIIKMALGIKLSSSHFNWIKKKKKKKKEKKKSNKFFASGCPELQINHFDLNLLIL